MTCFSMNSIDVSARFWGPAGTSDFFALAYDAPADAFACVVCAPFSAISGGTDTMTLGEHKVSATGNYRIAIPIKDRYVKISAKGTGTVTSSSLAISAIVGTV